MTTDIQLLEDTKLLFGLRTGQKITLTVTGQPVSRAPELWILASGQAEHTVIAYDRSRGNWTTTLLPGDYIVQMDAPGDSWFEGEVAFTLSAPATIFGSDAPVPAQPVAWTAAAGAARDPKNPSPPGLAARTVPDARWLSATLQSLYGRLRPRRSPPLNLPMPRPAAR